jgi:hypothetical protein
MQDVLQSAILYIRHLGFMAALVIKNNLPQVEPNPYNNFRQVRRCVLKTETKSKMAAIAAILDELRRNLPLLEANAHKIIQVDPSNRCQVN